MKKGGKGERVKYYFYTTKCHLKFGVGITFFKKAALL